MLHTEYYCSTALHFACARGHDGMVRAICGAGANPNIPDSNGATPIHKVTNELVCVAVHDYECSMFISQ